MKNPNIDEQYLEQVQSLHYDIDDSDSLYSNPSAEMFYAFLLGSFVAVFSAMYYEIRYDNSINKILFLIIWFVFGLISFALIHSFNNKNRIKYIEVTPQNIFLKRHNGVLDNILWQDIENIIVLFYDDTAWGKSKFATKTLSEIISILTKKSVDFKSLSYRFILQELYIKLNNGETQRYSINYKLMFNRENDLPYILQYYLDKYNVEQQTFNTATEITVNIENNKTFFSLLFFIFTLAIMVPCCILFWYFVFHLDFNIQVIGTVILFTVLTIFNIIIVYKKSKHLLNKGYHYLKSIIKK